MNTIKINGTEKSIFGLVKGDYLYKLAGISNNDKLFLDIKDEVDIPIEKDDFIIISGGEKIIVGQADIPNNPKLRNKISIQLNGVNIELDRPKIKGGDICKKDTALESPKLYADITNSPDQYIEDVWTLIVRGDEHFITIPKNKYKIKIDGEKYITEKSHLLGKEILALTGKEWQKFDLQQKFKGGKREPIKPEKKVDLSIEGVERFETVPKQAQQG